MPGTVLDSGNSTVDKAGEAQCLKQDDKGQGQPRVWSEYTGGVVIPACWEEPGKATQRR